MKEKLPKIFANKIDKEIKNNNKIYTSNNKAEENTIETKLNNQQSILDKQNKKSIEQKINEILKSKQYVYKIPVRIKLKDKEINTKIIGKNNTNIITMDNELIKIKEIEDIEINKKNE